MKRRVLLLLIAVVLAGCSTGDHDVHLFYYRGTDPYIRTFVDQIEAETGGRFTLESFDARNSQSLQNEQIANVLDGRTDLVIVNPVDRLGSYAIIRRLREADTPVIFFNREPLERDLEEYDRTWYVGAKAEQSARLQAELVMELFGGDPERLNHHDTSRDGEIQAIILKGEQGHQDAEIRTSEVLRAFETGGFAVDVLRIEVANWDRSEAYTAMKDLIVSYEAELELVISNNDAMALGAISRMRQQGFFRDDNGDGRIDRNDASWIPVVGIDGIDDAVEQIEQGYLYGTVKNDSQRMAEAIVELALNVLSGKEATALSFPVENGRYIWVDYQPFVLE